MEELSGDEGSVELLIVFELITCVHLQDVMTALTGSDIDTSRQVLSCLKSLSTLPCFKTFSYLSIETLVKLVSSCCHFAERSDTLTQLYTNYICCDSGDADKCCRSTSCAAALLLSTCITVLLERISQQAKGRSLSLPVSPAIFISLRSLLPSGGFISLTFARHGKCQRKGNMLVWERKFCFTPCQISFYYYPFRQFFI